MMNSVMLTNHSSTKSQALVYICAQREATIHVHFTLIIDSFNDLWQNINLMYEDKLSK